MKYAKSTAVLIGIMAISTSAMAQQQLADSSLVQQKYQMYLDQGKTYRDAFEALQYEIAYEQAAVQSKSPCRKLVRGL